MVSFLKVVAKLGVQGTKWAWANKGKVLEWIAAGMAIEWIVNKINQING